MLAVPSYMLDDVHLYSINDLLSVSVYIYYILYNLHVLYVA